MSHYRFPQHLLFCLAFVGTAAFCRCLQETGPFLFIVLVLLDRFCNFHFFFLWSYAFSLIVFVLDLEISLLFCPDFGPILLTIHTVALKEEDCNPLKNN